MKTDLIDENIISKTCLFNSKPIVLNVDLAIIFGDSNMALIFQQLHYWISFNKEASLKGIAKIDTLHEGRYWCFQTYEEWEKQFPWIDKRTIQRKIKKLEELQVVISGNFNKLNLDRTKWYTINYKKLLELQEELLDKKVAENIEKSKKRKQQERQATEKFKENKSKKNVNNSVDNMLKQCGKQSNFPNGQNVYFPNGQNVYFPNGQNVYLQMDKMSIAIQETKTQEINDIQEINIDKTTKTKTSQSSLSVSYEYIENVLNKLLQQKTVIVKNKKRNIKNLEIKEKDFKHLINYTLDAYNSNTTEIKNVNAYIKGILVNSIIEKSYLHNEHENIETKINKNKFINYKQETFDHEKLKKLQFELLKREIGEIEEESEEKKQNKKYIRV